MSLYVKTDPGLHGICQHNLPLPPEELQTLPLPLSKPKVLVTQCRRCLVSTHPWGSEAAEDVAQRLASGRESENSSCLWSFQVTALLRSLEEPCFTAYPLGHVLSGGCRIFLIHHISFSNHFFQRLWYFGCVGWGIRSDELERCCIGWRTASPKEKELRH